MQLYIHHSLQPAQQTAVTAGYDQLSLAGPLLGSSVIQLHCSRLYEPPVLNCEHAQKNNVKVSAHCVVICLMLMCSAIIIMHTK